MHIREISAPDTHELRRSVLRDGTPSDQVEWNGDDEPTTFHLGVRLDEGTIVAISTWLARREMLTFVTGSAESCHGRKVAANLPIPMKP